MIRIVFHFSIRIGGKEGKATKAAEPRADKNAHTVASEAEHAISMLETSRRKSTIDNYRTALHSLLEYAGQALTTSSLTKQLIEGWQQWLRGRNVSLNTVSCYMRSLRTVLQQTDVSRADSLFKGVFTGAVKTVKRSISADDICRLRDLPLSGSPGLQFSRDIFLFCICALGMPLVDVAFLRKQQVADGYISYQRRKTGQPIRIRIEPAMQRIIKRYAVPGSPYLFPILKQGTTQEYRTFRTRYNRHLLKLADMAHVSRRLTSYVARHSWASLAYHANVDLAVISKALGHTSSRTTQIYIRDIDDQRIDVANRQLLKHLIKPKATGNPEDGSRRHLFRFNKT